MTVTESSPDGCVSTRARAHEGAPRRQSAREPAARTYARALPVVPVRARGLTIEDADGRRYLDCLSGAGTLALGHNHPVVLEAVRRVLDSGAPLHALDLATPVQDAFVAELCRTLPAGLAGHARVRFCGPAATEAVETACALVRAATGRTGIVALAGSAPGTSAGAPAASENAAGARVAHPPLPPDRRGPAGGTAGAGRAARRTASVLDDLTPDGPLPAGVILEPVQGEGEEAPYSFDDWLRRVRRVTAGRSVPLIADETETGLGRTGAFWAVEHSGITPDVMVLSKAVGGSLPLAVVVHRDDLDVGTGGHADVFRGNQLAMAAGTATLAHVRENRLAGRAADLGSRMQSRLRTLAREFPCLGDVRGRGLMIGLRLADPEGQPEPASGPGDGRDAAPPAAGAHGLRRPTAPELAAAVQRECLRRGLLVGLGRRRSDVVRLLPPLTISDEQAEAVLDRLADAVEAVARAPLVRAGWERPPHEEPS